MKNQIRIIGMLGLLLFAVSGFAQTTFGFKAGVSRAGLDGTGFLESASPVMKDFTAFSFGVVSNIPVKRNLSFQPELSYSQKGFRLYLDDAIKALQDLDETFNVNTETGSFNTDDLSGININIITEIKYVEMPLLAKYSFGNQRVRGYIIGGPTLNYAVSGKLRPRIKILVNIPLPNIPFNLDAINYERFEVGATVGAGATFPTGENGNFFLDARYSHGLTSIFNINLGDNGLYNQGIQLNAGYIFQF